MMRTMGTKVKTWLVILAGAGVPLATTITCDPYDGALYVDRYEDRNLFDIIEDTFDDGCFLHDCHHDEIIFWD